MSYRRCWHTLTPILSIGLVMAAGLLVPGTVAAASSSVVMQNFAFMPAAVNITAGDSVTWTNQQDGVMHTVTADDGSFDSGRLATGQRFSMTFATAGTIAYHCNIHPSMHGTITVAGAAAPAATSAGRPAATAAAATAAAVTAPVRQSPARPAASARAQAVPARAAAPASQPPPVRQAPAAQAPAARVALPNTGTGGRTEDRGKPLIPLGIGSLGLGLVSLGLLRFRRCR